MMMRSRIAQLGLAAALLWTFSLSAVRADDVYFDVSVRGSGKATIHANVYKNPSNKGKTTILAVHGLTETGSTFKPLANAIFGDSVLGKVVARVVAIDLPGHGESSVPTLPSPLRFTDLTINDNVSVVIQSIDILRSRQLGAQVILGHSMGGLAIQAAQEALLANNSSLAKHGIVGAILIAAVPNAGSVWTQGPPADLSPFIVTSDQTLGAYLDLPPQVWAVGTGFRTLTGALVPNAPTPEQVAQNDWAGIEPLTTLLQLVGTTAPLIRPTARRKAFETRNGTVLAVVSFSQDVLTPAVDQDDLYLYLTGSSGPLYRPVVANDACHSMFISNPTGLLGALRNGVLQ